MKECIVIDDLEIEIRRSARRKNVDLIVDRHGDIVISVPQPLPQDEIHRICKQKQVWLYQTLNRKQQSLSFPEAKKYVTGEGFYYLGRKYRLKLLYGSKANSSRQVTFRNGRLFLHSDRVDQGRELFVKWYTKRASLWLEKKMSQLSLRVATNPKSVQVRDLGYRWGSCTKSGRVYFHWRIILLPPQRIEYLVLHELVHLIEHSHNSEFYRRLSRACPDYKNHQNWLRIYGDQYAL